MPANDSLQRVAFSPREFASLFGKSLAWAYRQIYAQKITTITTHGRILIPAAEVKRILESAAAYSGSRPKLANTKSEIQSLAGELKSTWADFVRSRRGGSREKGTEKSEQRTGKGNRQPSRSLRAEAIARLARGPRIRNKK